MQAREHGGAMGTAVVGFQWVQGKPVFEVHDPRWCTPEFDEHGSLRLLSLEKRYMYAREVQDPATKKYQTKLFWYRRVIDGNSDIVFAEVEVTEDEPQWQVKKQVDHGLQFCPVVWLHNLPVESELDGDPDCDPFVYEKSENIDKLRSQASRGAIANCFGAETPFITDQGVARLGDFEHGAKVTVLTHKGQWKPAVVKSFGVQPLNVVTLQRGTRGRPMAVRATPDHRWLLESGEETTALEVGDRLMQAPSKFSEFSYETATEQEKRHWCAGFVWGDGSALRKGDREYGSRLRLCGSKAKYLGRFLECGFTVTHPPSAGGEPVVHSGEMGKRLPQTRMGLTTLRAFVRGFVDADGTKSKKKSSRWKRLQVTGEEAIQFVRWALPAVGLYITCEAEVVGATNYGPRTARTVRFELNECASKHANSAWRVVAIEKCPLPETVWCLQTQDDRSMVLPFGVATGQCDPTLVFTTKAELNDIKKGSGNALRVPEGDAKYLEMTGSGIKAAMEIAADEKKEALEQAQCVLESETATAKTATEIERRYQSMISKTDKMREQYGPQGIVPLMDMVFQAAAKLAAPVTQPAIDPVTGQPQVDEFGQPITTIVRGTFKLAPKRMVDPATGAVTFVDREPGDGGTVKLKWPGYFTPTAADVEQASRAAVAAKDGGLIDDETAIRYVAPYFKAEDDHDLVNKVRSQAADKEAQMNAMMMQQTAVGRDPLAGGPGVENEPRVPNGVDTPGLPA